MPSNRLAPWVAPLAGLLLAATPLAAQQGGGFGRDMFNSTVSSRDVAQFREILEMGDEQSELVDLLYEGYAEENRAISEEMREAFRAARDAEGENRWEGIRDQMQVFQARRQEMEKTFMADVRSVLTADQLERWPKVERAHNRSRHLRRGLIRGERVDLIEVVEDMDIDSASREAIDPILESYEIELDRQLMKRVEQYSEGWEEFGELRRDGDMEGIQKLMEKGRDASLRVKQVNDRFARQIAGLLPDDQQQAFSSAVNMAVFPDVYRPRQSRRAIDAAGQFVDLNEDQSARIRALSETYARRDAAVNAKLVETLEEEEENATFEDMFRRGRDDGPAGELWREKRTLDRETLEDLKEILTPEQVERLPEPEREERQRGGQRGRQGGRNQIS